jgi:hypothetical protein
MECTPVATGERPNPSNSATAQNAGVPKKWLSMVRVKPLMKDEIININLKEKDKVFKGVDGDTCIMNFSRGEEKFKLDKVIHEDEGQESAFNNLMLGYIQNFMEGYNVTVLASGQTGSGKTYTMIAPVGSIKKKGGHDLSGAILDHYGLFPRTVLQLYQQVAGGGSICTLSIC